MMAIIFIILIFALILIAWCWNNLGQITKSKKITNIVGGLIVVYIYTFIIYNISKMGIKYEDIETMKIIRTVFVLIFTFVNGYILLPFSFRKIAKINIKEIEENDLKKSIIIFMIILVMLFIIEVLYFERLQRGILDR